LSRSRFLADDDRSPTAIFTKQGIDHMERSSENDSRSTPAKPMKGNVFGSPIERHPENQRGGQQPWPRRFQRREGDLVQSSAGLI